MDGGGKCGGGKGKGGGLDDLVVIKESSAGRDIPSMVAVDLGWGQNAQ